jgi:4-hydroxymandelate oxidase
VFSAAPPPPGGAVSGVLGLTRLARLAFPSPTGPVLDALNTARLDEYLRDLLSSHGLGPAAADPAAGGESYGEMAGELLELAVPEQEPVDLLVLAYSIPDISPGHSLTARLSRQCPGNPLAFAISDQGTAASFTGLRLVRQYTRDTGLHRAVLLVVEQALLPYDPGVPVAVPDGHTGVALVFSDDDAPSSADRPVHLGSVVTRAGLPDEALPREINTLCADTQPVTLILSAALADRVKAPDVDRLRTAQVGQPFTGVWWELANELSLASDTPHRIVLGDYDPQQSCLCLAALEVGAAGEPLSVGARSALTAEPLPADA